MNPYLSPATVRAALRSLGLTPTRGMGQHFLIDAEVLRQITDAAHLTRADLVIEVGAGLGVLTWELVRRAGRVIAVELDKRLAAHLRKAFAAPQPDWAPLDILQGDILDFPPSMLLQRSGALVADAGSPTPSAPSYGVVANLPYAITSPVLRHFLESPCPPTRMVVLVQWEVAMRITAQPGDLNLLAHAVQFYAEPVVVGRVDAGSFFPRPAVDSAILSLRVRSTPAVAVEDVPAFFRVIKAGFLHPRKKLSNGFPAGLQAMGQNISRAAAIAALQEAGILPDRRPETVRLEEWAALYSVLSRNIALPM